jgi:IclR family acetate operon transcriptional repressor
METRIPKSASRKPRRRRPTRTIALVDDDQSRASERYYSRTIARALDVLESFRDEGTALNLREIGQLTQLPEASLFRILVTLRSRGYLQQNGDGSYRLTPRVLMGKLQERAERLQKVIHPHLQALARRFDETASLAHLCGERIEVLDTVESFHEIRIKNKPGRVVPPHCSSLGKAITAFQSPDLIDQILEVYGLFRRTDHTIVDRQALLTEFERIRSLGYAVDREESMLGGICLSTPIFSTGGRAVASISISTPTIRMTPAREREIVEALRRSCSEISSTDLMRM